MAIQALEGVPGGWRGLRQAWAQRPLACAAVGLAVGLSLGRHLALPSALFWLLALGALAGLVTDLNREESRSLARWLCLAGLAAGLARVQPLRQALDAAPAPDRARLRLEARLLVDEGPRPETHRHIYLVQPLGLQDLALQTEPMPPGRLRLSVDLNDALDWAPGDRIECYGTLREPGPTTNPGEFEYRRYLWGRGIAGSFSAKQGWPARRLQAASAWDWRYRLWQLRQAMGRGLAAGLDARALTLASGIVLGDKAGFSREDYSAYARSGFADILAVSGAHFTLALGLVLLLARLFTRSRRKQAWAGLIFSLAYALITGFGAPVQRAFALFAVWLLARALDWECEAPTSLALGVLLILGWQPGALWEAGFQLSLGCTLAVLLLGPVLARGLPARWPAWLRFALGASLAAQAALAPLLAHHFHQLCWPGLLACLVSGLFTAGIVGLGLPLAVLGGRVPGAALILGWPLQQLLRLLDASANALSRWPGAAYSTGLVPRWIPAAVLLWCLALLFYAGPWRRSVLALTASSLLLALLWPGLPWQQRHPGETRLWMLDIGQGDSFVAQFEDGRTLLMDGGPARPDAGAWVVVPALRALGIQRLDWVVASHADADHVGGLAWVLDQMPVGVLLTNGQRSTTQAWTALIDSAQRRGVPQRRLGTDVAPTPDDGPWTVLAPIPVKHRVSHSKRKRKHPRRVDTNAASIVLRVENWLLLTGDLPKPVEKKLLRRGLQPIEVLKVGHHGSKGSSSPAFVHRLMPAQALISCGRHNRYGHPAQAALNALKGVTLWRTDLQGSVRLIKKTGQPVEVVPWRSAMPADLARAAPRYRSPWRGSDALRQAAWRRAQAPPDLEPDGPEKDGENGPETGPQQDGDAA